MGFGLLFAGLVSSALIGAITNSYKTFKICLIGLVVGTFVGLGITELKSKLSEKSDNSSTKVVTNEVNTSESLSMLFMQYLPLVTMLTNSNSQSGIAGQITGLTEDFEVVTKPILQMLRDPPYINDS